MSQRRSPPPPCGVEFPVSDPSTGTRGTTEVNKAVWEASFRPLDEKVAAEVAKTPSRRWRHGYARFIRKHVELALADPEAARQSAKAGLDALYSTMEFVRDGETCSLEDAFDGRFKGSFNTVFIEGEKSAPAEGSEIVVPYKGQELKGEALKKQVRAWANYGTIEPDCAQAIVDVVDNGWSSKVRDRYFVLLGTSAAMGPFEVLMSLGANVVAVDYGPMDRIWSKLINTARNSSGTLTLPVRDEVEKYRVGNDGWDYEKLIKEAGCDLLKQTPEIANWVSSLYPGKELAMGSYVYLNGGLFVRLSLAADAVMREVSRRRMEETNTPSTLCFLCTPTDVHMINAEARRAAQSNGSLGNMFNLLLLPFRFCPMRKMKLVRNVQRPVAASSSSEVLHWVDGLVVDQGPNYALAKRLQHWRSILARDQGHSISSNVAPSTSTLSVVQNRTFAWAYDGMSWFKPMEIFPQEVSNSVMTALLINDVFNPNSVAHPTHKLSNPYEIMARTSFHGGVWRTGYTMGSIGGVAVLIHFVKVLLPYLILIALLWLVASQFLL